VTPLWANPEFIRNCRAQLRPRRLMVVASVVAVLSLVIGYSTFQTYNGTREWGTTFLGLALSAQMVVLILGGGITCGLSISREKEQNTFDFQRVTQLTALELALGKLFGAPALAYFVAICTIPAALVGAMAGGTSISLLAGAYLLLLTASIAVHALALVYSMGVTKGGTSVAGLVLIFAFLTSVTPAAQQRLIFDLGMLGPAAAVDFALHGTWEVRAKLTTSTSPWTDVFFGVPVHHLPVLLVLYLTFTAWCLLALARNLKRDPAMLELFSPAQSVGLLCYVNFIMVGFYMLRRPYPNAGFGWRTETLSTTFEFFLMVNLGLLYLLGLVLLRNREQARRRAYERAGSGFDWQEAAWPAVCILTGAGVVAVLLMGRFALAPGMANDLNAPFAAFQTAVLLAAIVRDLSYLQWMNLRRTRRPLIMAVVLLCVFYTCASLLVSLARFSKPVATMLSAILVPWAAATLEPAEWTANPGPWFVGLAVQIALTVLLAALHYQASAELSPPTVGAPARATAS